MTIDSDSEAETKHSKKSAKKQVPVIPVDEDIQVSKEFHIEDLDLPRGPQAHKFENKTLWSYTS